MCEKFCHTRFEPSGFTGNQEIPIAKSVMDYIFRWLEIRFVSGQQFPLFPQLNAGVAQLPGSPERAGFARSGVEGNVVQGAVPVNLPPVEIAETTPPQGGLVSDFAKGQGLSAKGSIEDRGLYHSADALRELVDLGDAPSCHVCGAIMTRNGSCYRCMSCGSTSGCS